MAPLNLFLQNKGPKTAAELEAEAARAEEAKQFRESLHSLCEKRCSQLRELREIRKTVKSDLAILQSRYVAYVRAVQQRFPKLTIETITVPFSVESVQKRDESFVEFEKEQSIMFTNHLQKIFELKAREILIETVDDPPSKYLGFQDKLEEKRDLEIKKVAPELQRKFRLEDEVSQLEFMLQSITEEVCETRCKKCNSEGKMVKCQNCSFAYYCGKSCQTLDSEKHKLICTVFHFLKIAFLICTPAAGLGVRVQSSARAETGNFARD